MFQARIKTSGLPCLCLLLIFVFGMLSVIEATAADAGKFNQGVSLYNSGRYAQALPFLEGAVRSSPYNVSAHYYLALCYQTLKQSTLARQHFEWVARNPQNPTLQAYAVKALQGHATVAGASSGSVISAPASPLSQVDGNTAVASKNLGRCKVFVVETASCPYCHEFAPRFDQAASKYSAAMDFQHIDAEDPSNAEFKEKYGIKSYPRLVYLDGKGNLLYNEGRGNFENRLHELTGK